MSENRVPLPDAIEEFIQENLPIGAEDGSDVRFVSDGLFDSLALLRLFSLVEQTLGRELDDDDFAATNFDSRSAIAALMARHGWR